MHYVTFQQDLTGIHDLNFSAKALVLHFGNGTGTEQNDTIRFARNADAAFGTHANTIDLKEGNNKVQLDSGARVAVYADFSNVSTVKTASSVTANFADIAFAASRNAALDIGKNTNIITENILRTDKKNTIKAGAGTAVTLQNVTLQSAADKISIDSGSRFIAGTIDFGIGSDRLSVGKNSNFCAECIKGADTIEFSAHSTTEVKGSITETKKLSISNGKNGQIAALKASAVTGTAGNDSYSFGNWNRVDLASLDFGEGNDTLKIGSYADAAISSLAFGEGSKDKLTIGKSATLSVDTLDVASLDTLSMSKDSCLMIADAEDLAEAKAKWSKYSSQIISKLA